MTYSSVRLSTYLLLLVAALDISGQTNDPSLVPVVVRGQQPLVVGSAQFAAGKPLMPPTAQPSAQPMWTDIAQAISSVGAFLVAVFGFAFVIRQLMQVENTLRKDALESLYERSFAIQSVILQDPQLRPFFYDNAPVPSDTTLLAKLETFPKWSLTFTNSS